MTTMSQTTSRCDRRIGVHAYTLPEVMVALVIGSLILAGVMTTFIAVLKSSMRLWAYETMERESNQGLEYFARDIRMAKSITWASDTSITLVVPRANGGADRTVTFSWNNGTRTFNQTENGVVTTLVNDVQSLAFNRFNLAQDPASNDLETTQIQLTLTAAPNTQSLYAESSKRVMSARFVLRNK